MYKHLCKLVTTILLIILVVGCTPSDAPVKIAENYKHTEFTITDISTPEAIDKQLEKVESFLTEQFSNEQYENRNITLPIEVAQKKALELKPENPDFNMIPVKNRGVVTFEYSIDLSLINTSNNEKTILPLKGELTLERVNGVWLVQRDEYNIDELKEIIKE